MAKQSGGDGKNLEDLVATIESLLIPQGFTVEKNDRVFNDDGVQVAELDIVIRGKVGSATFSWLIECRNRPSDGAAPGSWIEQIFGRRSRFNFDKVTAVSTTGFAAGAAAYAASVGIDLREVHEVAPDVMGWLGIRAMRSQEQRHFLHSACLRISGTESEERQQAFLGTAVGSGHEQPLLRSTETGTMSSTVDAFVGAVKQNPSCLADVIPNGPAKRIKITIQYPDEKSHFVVDTALGPVRIVEIDFDGELSIIETVVPLSRVAEYRTVGKNEPVAQTAAFTFEVRGEQVSFELHRLVESGETHMAVRRLGDAPGVSMPGTSNDPTA